VTANLICVGVNHRTAAVELRERIAFPAETLEANVREMASLPGAEEAVLVSTCNRVEAYVCGSGTGLDLLDRVTRRIAQSRGVPLEKLNPATYRHEGADAVRHLLRVSASLDSLVLGEPQILGQVKEAFQNAREAGTVGTLLTRVFERAFKTAKRIRTETGIARNAVSVGTVAVDLARNIFASLADCLVLVVGAGKMGTLAARHLAASGAGRVWVTNRSSERAVKLAEEHGWEAKAFSDLSLLLQQVDIVITSTGATRPIFTRDLLQPLMPKRKFRPLFLIDIAVPRDVDQDVGRIDNVFVYNIDDLESFTKSAAEARSKDVERASAIVEAEVEQHLRWAQNLAVTPTITALRRHATELAAVEMERTLGGAAANREVLERFAQGFINKLLHDPMTAMKDPGEGERLAAAARQLFNLTELVVIESEGRADGDQRSQDGP